MSSIQRRLTLPIGVGCCLLWFAGSFIVYLGVRAELVSEFDVALKANALALTNMTEESTNQFKFNATGDLIPEFDREERFNYFQIWLRDGSTLQRSSGLALDDKDLLRRAGTLNQPKFWNLTLPGGRRGRAIGFQFQPKIDENAPPTPGVSRPRGPLTLVAAYHLGDIDRQLYRLASLLVLAGVTTAAATMAVVATVVRTGLQPLAKLAERAGKIDASSLQLRFPLDHAPSELHSIVQRLNDLLGRLEASFTRERRFSADVAHELRTPIAELRAATEIALKWPDDSAATEAALKDALNIALQMESIATKLLMLVRCEGKLFTAHPESVSIAALFDEVFQPLAAKTRSKRLALSVELPKEACWLTDQLALRSILANLVSNAIEHSPTAGAVRVWMEHYGAGDRLLISNLTDNLTAEDIPHLFERFWRKDAARTDHSHCGLGLSVAHTFAELLQLTLSAELINTNEITFALSSAVSCHSMKEAESHVQPQRDKLFLEVEPML